LAAERAQHLAERLRLREVAWIPVEDEAGERVAAVETVADQGDRDVVGNELARGQDRLDLLAEIRAARDRLPVEIPARDVRDAVGRRDLLGLRALARALRTQYENVQRRNPS
jgi:hypothetical protein